MTRGLARPLSVAPMVDRSDRHFRVVMRAVTRRVLLYTEMVPVVAALDPSRRRALEFDPVEHPLALQLGGEDPARLAEAAALAEALGYDEVDLNCGCPSPRVQAGCFGVVLMERPERVAECVRAMRSAASRPVTVKHRLGVDALDRYADVARFVEVVSRAGADRFIVHARKAWLQGLSPRQNRSVPPLRYPWVHRLRRDFPELRIELNGGVRSLREAVEHLDAGVHGVMIGRAAVDDPMIFAGADDVLRARAEGGSVVLPAVGAAERIAVLRSLSAYVRRWAGGGGRVSSVTRHVLGLSTGVAGSRRFRRALVEGTRRPDADPAVYDAAVDQLEATALAGARVA